METYEELKKRQSKEVSELPIGFAFSDEQFLMGELKIAMLSMFGTIKRQLRIHVVSFRLSQTPRQHGFSFLSKSQKIMGYP